MPDSQVNLLAVVIFAAAILAIILATLIKSVIVLMRAVKGNPITSTDWLTIAATAIAIGIVGYVVIELAIIDA